MRLPLHSPLRTPSLKQPTSITQSNASTIQNQQNELTNTNNGDQHLAAKSDQLPPHSSSNAPFTTKLTINNGGVNLKQQARVILANGQQQQLQSASSSRMLSDYEISPELSSKLEEWTENKYGGRELANSAAIKIQRYYRHYKLRQRFQRVTGQQRGNDVLTQQKSQKDAIHSKKKTLANTIFTSSIGTNSNQQNRRVVAYQFQSANSQPILLSRCQPTTSLSSQLRAERQQGNGRPIDLNPDSPPNEISSIGSTFSIQTGFSMRSKGGGMKEQTQRNPFMDTPATPRLCQRRIPQQIPSGSTVFSSNPRHQPMANFHPELFYSNGPSTIENTERKNVQKGTATVENKFGSTTILVDYENSTNALNGIGGHQNGDEELLEDSAKSGYHRSQSPAMHSTNSGTGLQVVQLLSSPGRSHQMSGIGTRSQGHSPSSSPMRHPQPPPLPPSLATMTALNSNVSYIDVRSTKLPSQHPSTGNRSVWMPRQLVTGPSPSMHQQQIQQRQMAAFHHQQQQHFSSSSSISSAHHLQQKQQMISNGNVGIGGYPIQQQFYHQNRTPVVSRSHSSAASCGYQTGSLPRMGRQQMLVQQPREGSTQPQIMGPAIAHNGEIAQNIVAADSTGGTAASVPGASITGVVAPTPAAMQLRPEWSEQKRRRLYRIALNFFNKKPDRGVLLLIRWCFVEDSSHALAKFFKERKGLSKQMIGEYLGTLKSPFHAAVLEHFIAEIPMYDMEIDNALRQLLIHFRLPGEAQKIDHIIQAFAHRYVQCNPHRLSALSAQDPDDTVYILAFAIIMLNTDLHTPSLKDSRRMKLEEFIKNLSHVEQGKNLNRQMLADIYKRVKDVEFRAGTDHVTQVLKVDQSIVSKEKPKLVEPHRRLICYCRLHQIADVNKRQSANAHQREIFLFNDLMFVCKLMGGRRSSTSNNSIGQYQLRYPSQLIGLHVEEFQNSIFSNGMYVHFPDGQMLAFNAKNWDDRSRFIADIRESVAESTEMEQWRIQLQMEQQQPNGHHQQPPHSRLMAGIGARLAEHSFQLPQTAGQYQQRLKNGGVTLYHQHHNNTSIGSSTASAGTTIATTTDSIQRDSGLPDMDCCHNSAGHSHSHSTASSPTSASPSPADFT